MILLIILFYSHPRFTVPSAPTDIKDITAASSVDELVLTGPLTGEDKQKIMLAADAEYFSIIRSAVLNCPPFDLQYSSALTFPQRPASR